MTTYGTNTVKLLKEETCPDQQIPPPSNIINTKNLLVDKSEFLGKSFNLTDRPLILPFKNSEIFKYNYNQSGTVKNYGGIQVTVYYLPESYSSIDDISFISTTAGDATTGDCNRFTITKPDINIFTTSGTKRNREDEDINIEIDGNVSGPLFVTVIQNYTDKALGSFYIK